MKNLIVITFILMGMTFANEPVIKSSNSEYTGKSLMSANNIIMKKTMILLANLQASIFASLREYYPDHYLIEAYKIENINNNLMVYQVKLEKGKSKVDVFYDKNGRFLWTGSFSKSLSSFGYILNNWPLDYKLISAGNGKPGC